MGAGAESNKISGPSGRSTFVFSMYGDSRQGNTNGAGDEAIAAQEEYRPNGGDV